MARQLYRYQQLLSIGGSGFSAEIDTLPLADFRARPELTLARAEQFDQEVKAWAIKELSEAKQAERDDDEE